MNEPLVSILISVYNAGDYLRPSVESVLCQTYANIEVLIIDDGSTDHCMDSINHINDSRIRIISQPNSGKAVALNRALEELSGEFYAIHDADDISYPQRIEQQVRCLLENPQLAAVFTGHDIILDGRRLAPRFAFKNIEQCRWDIENMRLPAHDPTVMFRVSKVKDITYESTLRVGQGWDYILRVGEQYPMMVLGECLYSYRVHFESITRQDWDRRKQKIRNVKERACQRRGLNVDEFFPSRFKSSPAVIHREKEIGIVPHFMESVLDLRRAGRRQEALLTALACLRLHPCDIYYYKPLTYFLMPLGLVEYYRSKKRE
jgi:glycosyltransferase involved in cell wall biosynthesis